MSGVRRLIVHAVLLAGLAAVLFPFAWMIATSLKTKEEAETSARFLPVKPQFENYKTSWIGARKITSGRYTFGRFFLNSLWVAAWVVGGVLLTSCLAGYAFSCMEFPGKKIMFALFLSTMMVPFEVTLIPNFLTVRALGLHNTYAAMALPWCASAFSIFLVRQYMLSIPRDYLDAARIDGCGHAQTLLWIVAPMATPAFATIALFAFLGSWNAFLWPLLVIDDSSKYVVQYGLALFVQEDAASYNIVMAAAATAIAPVVVLYLAAQKRFTAGVMGAGLKG